MTEYITFWNIDLSSWITPCIYLTEESRLENNQP